MNGPETLLPEVAGWGGYLLRPTVLIQVLIVALVLAAEAQLRRHARPDRRQALLRPLSLLLLALLTALLALAGRPWGLAAFLSWALAGWSALRLLHRALAHVIEPDSLKLIDSRLLRPMYLVVVALALIDRFDNLQDLALVPLGSWFGSRVNLGQLFGATVTVYLLAMGTGPPAQGVAWLAQRFLHISDGSRRALALMLRYLAVGLGVVWALDHIGVNGTALLAVAGGLSVGLGFGIKEVFSNFISGLWLLFEGSVRPGEVLFVEGDPCEVRSLGLRAAVLWRDRDNAELVVPNQTFFTAATTTYTGTDRLRRSQVLVGAAYRHDPAIVISLLEATAAACPRVLAAPSPRGLLLSYGDSAIQYALRFWIADPMDNVSICSEVQVAVWQAFRQHDIEIPFPQQVQYQVELPPPPDAPTPPL
ncbi:mechanosensitive ion channel [Cyanobium sp. FGCU-6]|jgi:potassium efflux system protein|nr:mechanosensitive ion channel [Cyanobium sp. FGCU6]